jgi:hypothetical protein
MTIWVQRTLTSRPWKPAWAIRRRSPPGHMVRWTSAWSVPGSMEKLCSARVLEAALASCRGHIRSVAADDVAYGQFAPPACSRLAGGDLRV